MKVTIRLQGGLLLALAVSSQLCWGQPLETAPAVRYSGRLDYDSYFGFYPSMSISLSLDSLREVTGYATYYTNPSFSGLETGMSVSFSSARRNWSITPGIGLVSGSLFVSERSFAWAEGFVGILSVQHEGRLGHIQAYGGYYGACRRLTSDTYDFFYGSVQAGRYLSKQWRIAVVYEQMANVRLLRNRTDASEFSVPRIGLATDFYATHAFAIQVAGGWAHSDEQHLFVRAGLSWLLARHTH